MNDILEEPALHRRTFTELSRDERRELLQQLRARRETIERRVKAARIAAETLSPRTVARKAADRAIKKIDALWLKLEDMSLKLEQHIEAILGEE